MTRPLVVLDALLLRPQPTGVGRSILELTAALAAEDRGFDFAVLCTHPEMLSDLDGRPGWRLIRCSGAMGGTLRKALWTQIAMPRVVAALGGNLLHTLQFVAPMRHPCPTVVTVHDLGFLWFPDTVEQPRRSYYRYLVPRSLQAAGAIVCNSDATAQDVRERFSQVADKVATTPFGTPSWVLGRPVSPTPRAADAPFLFVGTLEPRKNLERLLRAYRCFVGQRDGLTVPVPDLVLVGGRGWKDSTIRSDLATLRESGKVRLLEYCDLDELWQQYGLARALLLPSLHEGFGFPILEAMSADLPVLTSHCGAMAEVAGDAGLLVDPNDQDDMVRAMHRLVDDPSLCEDLVSRGRRRREVWTWQRTATATVKVYRRLLEGAGATNRSRE